VHADETRPSGHRLHRPGGRSGRRPVGRRRGKYC
jgi:hypothetical protein